MEPKCPDLQTCKQEHRRCKVDFSQAFAVNVRVFESKRNARCMCMSAVRRWTVATAMKVVDDVDVDEGDV